MKIEFVGFYPNMGKKKDKNILGTCHIYLCDPYNMDIRGVRVTKRGKSLFFTLPGQWGFDAETKKAVLYPIVCFTDQKVKQAIIDFLCTEGKKEVGLELLRIEGIKVEKKG